MKYILEPSLEQITLVKITIFLWNQSVIKFLITELYLLERQNQILRELNDEWKNIENQVIKNVQYLPLPQNFQKKIVRFIKPIGLQILHWAKYHCTKDFLQIDLPYEFCWTLQGTINKKKTAEMLIKDDKLCIFKRYKLACIYCIESDVIELWNKMPKDIQNCVFLADNPTSSQKCLVNYWIDIMQGMDSEEICYKDAFQFFAKAGEKDATEYFFQKLTPSEIEEALITAAGMTRKVDVLHFLLSHMGNEQQIVVLEVDSCKILKCFLSWPLQSFFIEIANLTWDFLSAHSFRNLLDDILDRIKFGYKDFNYKILFGEFWKQSPCAFKSCIIHESVFLKSLLKYEDRKPLKVFLQNLSPAEKKKLIYYNHSICIFPELVMLIFQDKWDSLEILIKECLSSESEMMIFKEKFESCLLSNGWGDHLVRSTWNQDKWNQLFILSDDFV